MGGTSRSHLMSIIFVRIRRRSCFSAAQSAARNRLCYIWRITHIARSHDPGYIAYQRDHLYCNIYLALCRLCRVARVPTSHMSCARNYPAYRSEPGLNRKSFWVTQKSTLTMKVTDSIWAHSTFMSLWREYARAACAYVMSDLFLKIQYYAGQLKNSTRAINIFRDSLYRWQS